MLSNLQGFLLLCCVVGTIALVWVALPYLDDREYGQRFVGALNFTEEAIEATLDLHVDIYEPSMARGSKLGYWAVSGIMVSKDKLGGTARSRIFVNLESVCPESTDPSCWRMIELAIDGQVVDTPPLAGSTPETVVRSSRASDQEDSGDVTVGQRIAVLDADESVRQELVRAAQVAAAHAAALDRDLDAAQQKIVDLKEESGTAKADAASLAKQLAEIRKSHATALETVSADAETTHQEQLRAADNAITPIDGSSETSRAMDTMKSMPDSLTATRKPAEPLKLLNRELEWQVAAEQTLPPSATDTDDVNNVLITSRNTEDAAALAQSGPNALAESIGVDSLVTNPADFQGRDVVVTGSIFRLFQRYLLQPNSGEKSLVVEVRGVPPTKRMMFEKAMDAAGPVGSVRARIKARIVGDSTILYRLVASDLTLVE